MRLSGVSRKTSSVDIHRSVCEALRLMHSFDQLDASALAVGEHLTRWVIQTELAVERNPSAPDFSGPAGQLSFQMVGRLLPSFPSGSLQDSRRGLRSGSRKGFSIRNVDNFEGAAIVEKVMTTTAPRRTARATERRKRRRRRAARVRLPLPALLQGAPGEENELEHRGRAYAGDIVPALLLKSGNCMV